MSLYRRAFSRVQVLLLLLSCLMAGSAFAVSLKVEKLEIGMGEESIIRITDKDFISIVTGWSATEQLELLDSNSDQARVKGAKLGRATVKVNINGSNHEVTLDVVGTGDAQLDPLRVKFEGFVRALGTSGDVSKAARIARLLAEVTNETRGADSFFAELSKLGGKMTDVIALRSKLVSMPNSAMAQEIMGTRFPEGGTLAELRILTWRKQQTLAAIQDVISKFAGRVPADGVKLMVSHVGKWATQEPRALQFTGDIDFSFVSNDEALVKEMRAEFLEAIKRRTGMDQIAIDAVCTAHGKAGLEVYIGKHGMAFAEEQMKINFVIDLEKGTSKPAGFSEATHILTTEREMLEAHGKEPIKPAQNTEPGLSMEMVRHFDHDIVKPGIFDATNAVVKAAKYLDRSYQSLDKAGGKPEDAELASFAKEITELANAKPQTAEGRDKMIRRIAEFLGQSPKTVWDAGQKKLVLALDPGTIKAFHDKATQAMWKTVEQGSKQRTENVDTRLRELLDRQRRGERVDEDAAKLRTEMVALIDMVEAEVKAIHGAMEIPISVQTNNAKVRNLLSTLSKRFGVKVLSPEELKDKKFVEKLLAAEREKSNPTRREMLKAFIMDRAAWSAELAMKGVEKTNQILDFIDDGLLGNLRGDTDFSDFEAELDRIGIKSADPKTRNEAISQMGGLRSKVANGIKSTNETLNKSLQATAAGRQGMKFMAVYGLVDEMNAYRDAFNEQGWGGFATEIFRRRIPMGSAVESAVMGNTYRAAWDVVTTLIPPLGLPEAAWGLGTLVGTQARSLYWSEQLSLFVDTLYDSAKFKLVAVQQYDGAKVGEYRLVQVQHRGQTIDLAKFAEISKKQVEGLRQQIGKGRLDWSQYNQEFQGLTRWMDVDKVLQKNLADSDPAMALIEEMMNHESVGPQLMARLTEKGLVRWEEVKLNFITTLIKQLEDRKQADQALGAGQLPDMFKELRSTAAKLGVEEPMLNALNADVATNNLKILMNWLWDAKRFALGQAPTQSEYTRAAEVVKRYLDVYRRLLETRNEAERQLGPDTFRDGSQTYLTGVNFLSGRADQDPGSAQRWMQHIGQAHAATDESLLEIKRRYAPNAGLDDPLDRQYRSKIFPHVLWMKPYRDFASGRNDLAVMGWATAHDKERRRLLDEYEASLKRQNIVELTVVLRDKADANVTIENAVGKLAPTDAIGSALTVSGSGTLLFAAASGRYRLSVQAPGYESTLGEMLLGRNLNARVQIVVEMKPTKQADPKHNAEAADRLLTKAKELAQRGSYDEAIATALQAQKLDPENAEIPQWIRKWEQEKQRDKAIECQYQYSSWSECNANARKQYRSVLDRRPAGCVAQSAPVLEQSCVPLAQSGTTQNCGPVKFAGSASDVWSGGNTEKGFRMDRRRAEKPKPDPNYVTASLSIASASASKALPHDNLLPALEKEMKEGGTGGVPNDMSTGLEPWTPKALGGLAIDGFQGGLIDYGLWFKRNFSHSEGRGGSYFGWNGHGYVGKGPCLLEVRYSIGGGGSPEETDRAYLRSQAQAAKNEILGILASLKVDSNGNITKSPHTGRNLDGSDMLKVKLVPESLGKLKLGAARTLQAVVENVRSEDSPFKYTWTGSFDGSGSTVRVQTAKPGTYSISVAVEGSQGPAGSAGLEYTVLEPITIKLEKLKPEGNKIVVGQAGSFRATVMAGANVASGAFVTRWEPAQERAAKFTSREMQGATGTNDIRFLVPGRYQVYVDALEKVDGLLQTAGESEQIPMEVINPAWTMAFEPAEPKVGQMVRATLSAPGLSAEEIKSMNFEWKLPGNAKRSGPDQQPGVATFFLFDTRPANIQAVVRLDGELLGGAGKTLTAQGYQVSLGEPRYLGPPLQLWRCETQLGGAANCGMVALAPSQFVTHTDIHFSSSTTPPPEAPRYKWSVDPDGGCGFPGAGAEVKINCSSTGTITLKLEVSSADGVKLGEASRSITIAVSQNDIANASKAKEAYEKLQKARELVGAGRLDEGLVLAEEASRLDSKNTEAASLVNQWKGERERVQSHLRAMDTKLSQQKLDEAQRDLVEAQKLHPKYPPVADADKRLKEAQRKADEEKKKLEELKKAGEERLARARNLVAQGKLDEGIALIEEALRLDPKHADATNLATRWKAERQTVVQLLELVKQRLTANQIPDAQNALTQAQKLHPLYAPVVEAEKLLKAAQAQDARKKELAEKLAKAKELVLQGRLDEGIALLDEVLKLDPKHAESGALAAKWKSDRQTVAKHVENIRRLVLANNIVESEKELSAALRLQPKYGPVMDAQKLIADAKKRISEQQNVERTQREQQAQGLMREGNSLEQVGDLSGALKKYQESMKLSPNSPAQQSATRLEAVYRQAKGLWDEGAAARAAGHAVESLAKMQESIRLWPGDRERESYVAQLQQSVQAQQSRQDEAKSLRAQGETLQQQNRMTEAIAAYRESLKLVPDPRLEQHIQTIERQVQAEQQQHAQTLAQAKSLRTQGEALQQQNRLPEAISRYRESLKLVPDPRLEQHIQTLAHQVEAEKQKHVQMEAQAKR